MVDADEVEQAWSHYWSALEGLAELDNGRGAVQSPRKHNRLVDKMRAQRIILRSSSYGRAAVANLLNDPRAVVRLWAAGEVLAWDEAAARPVLEALRDNADMGLHRTSARYTLIEFDAGRLA